MSPFEFVATPTASPITTLSGNLRRLGAESNGVSFTATCANRGLAQNTTTAVKTKFEKRRMRASANKFDSLREDRSIFHRRPLPAGPLPPTAATSRPGEVAVSA